MLNIDRKIGHICCDQSTRLVKTQGKKSTTYVSEHKKGGREDSRSTKREVAGLRVVVGDGSRSGAKKKEDN